MVGSTPSHDHMEKRERQFIPGLSVLLLAAVALGTIGSLLHDFRGVGYGLAGTILWVGALLVTFLAGTVFLSRRLLPIGGNIGWSEGFRLLWRNYLSGVTGFLYGQQRDPAATSAKKKAKGLDLPPSFEFINAGFLFSHEAAAISRGTSYVRAAGPGLVLLRSGERITQIFDLRTQTRKMGVQATTRDGIPVETNVSVTFHVRRVSPDERRPRSVTPDTLPYPYDQEALFQLAYAGSATGAEDKQNWTEQVCPAAATLLVSEIGKYTLDQLLVSGGAEPMGKIRDNIRHALTARQRGEDKQVLSPGIEIVGVGVGPVGLPDEVLRKRVTTWQVAWQNRILQEGMSGDLEAQRLYQEARARAQVENVSNLLMSIETIRQQSQAGLQEVVMTRLIEVLESMAAGRALRQLEPRARANNLAALTAHELQELMEPGE